MIIVPSGARAKFDHRIARAVGERAIKVAQDNGNSHASDDFILTSNPSHVNSDGDGIYGRCSYGDGYSTIYVKTRGVDRKPFEYARTFVHELAHAAGGRTCRHGRSWRRLYAMMWAACADKLSNMGLWNEIDKTVLNYTRKTRRETIGEYHERVNREVHKVHHAALRVREQHGIPKYDLDRFVKPTYAEMA